MAAHRYWRVLCHTSNGGGNFAIAELVGRTVTGGANVFTGGTPSASSSYGGYPPTNAFDGDPNSAWASANAADGQWLQYDLGVGVTKDIMEIVITARNGGYSNQAPATADFQWSDDAATWTTLFTANAAYTDGQSQRFSTIVVPANTPEIGSAWVIGVETPQPANVQVAQIVMIGVITGPPFSISMGPAFKLPCWQPCTAFGTEAIVVIFNPQNRS